jgi:hypothetical protein
MIKVKLTKEEHRIIVAALKHHGNRCLDAVNQSFAQDIGLSNKQVVDCACVYYDLSRKVEQAKK